VLERIRRLRLGLMICGSVGLIPWIVFLSVSLPTTYVAQNWSATLTLGRIRRPAGDVAGHHRDSWLAT